MSSTKPGQKPDKPLQNEYTLYHKSVRFMQKVSQRFRHSTYDMKVVVAATHMIRAFILDIVVGS